MPNYRNYAELRFDWDEVASFFAQVGDEVVGLANDDHWCPLAAYIMERIPNSTADVDERRARAYLNDPETFHSDRPIVYHFFDSGTQYEFILRVDDTEPRTGRRYAEITGWQAYGFLTQARRIAAQNRAKRQQVMQQFRDDLSKGRVTAATDTGLPF